MKYLKIIGFFIILTTGCDQKQKEITIEEAIEATLSSTAHGFAYLSIETPEVLEKLQSDSNRSAELLTQQISLIDLPALQSSTQDEKYQQLEIIIETLGFIAKPEGDKVLSNLYIELQSLTANQPQGQTQAFDQLSNLTLDNLGSRYNPQVGESIFNQIHKMDKTKLHISLNYLATAGRGNSDVADALQSIINSSGAASNNKYVQATYEAVLK